MSKNKMFLSEVFSEYIERDLDYEIPFEFYLWERESEVEVINDENPSEIHRKKMDMAIAELKVQARIAFDIALGYNKDFVEVEHCGVNILIREA